MLDFACRRARKPRAHAPSCVRLAGSGDVCFGRSVGRCLIHLGSLAGCWPDVVMTHDRRRARRVIVLYCSSRQVRYATRPTATPSPPLLGDGPGGCQRGRLFDGFRSTPHGLVVRSAARGDATLHSTRIPLTVQQTGHTGPGCTHCLLAAMMFIFAVGTTLNKNSINNTVAHPFSA